MPRPPPVTRIVRSSDGMRLAGIVTSMARAAARGRCPPSPAAVSSGGPAPVNDEACTCHEPRLLGRQKERSVRLVSRLCDVCPALHPQRRHELPVLLYLGVRVCILIDRRARRAGAEGVDVDAEGAEL